MTRYRHPVRSRARVRALPAPIQLMPSPVGWLLVATIVGLLLMMAVAPSLGATIRVPSEQPTIQAAIDAAADGDTVLVAPGTYTGDGFHDIDFSTTTWPDPHNVVLVSEAGPEMTILDIQGSAATPRRGFVFHTGEGRESVVDGFTITNGWMSTEETRGQMRHDLSGGGMVIRFQTGPTIRNCIFLSNHSEFSGGALETELLATPLIEDCVFQGNSSSATGGAISVETQAAPVIRNCVFTGNVAGTCGGGVSFQSLGSQFGGVEFTDCVVAGNKADIGGGIDALFPADGVIIERSIIWGNCATISGGDVSAQDSAGFDFRCSAVDSTNAEGTGTITYDADCVFTDPFFCAPEPCENAPTTAGDYTLAENSPCTADNSPCGQLMGSLGIGCGPVVPIRATSWGGLKSRFRGSRP